MTDREWNPIASAPKDETWLILLFPDDGIPPEPRVSAGFWSPDGDWFDSEAASNSLTERYGPPTHWMKYVAPV